MKIGDKITCVKLDKGLILGKEYEVISYVPTWCGQDRPVIEVAKDGPPYYADHFILSKENTNMKIGQKIKCINDKDSESLVLGCEYEVTDVNQYGNVQVKQGNSNPLQHYYKPNRFVLATASSQTIGLAKEYKTRNGCRVKLFAISDDADLPVVGQYFSEGRWFNDQWSMSGSYTTYPTNSDEYDLVEVKQPADNFAAPYCQAAFFSDGSVLFQKPRSSNQEPSFSSDEFAELVKAYEAFNSQA